jgi:hypothetical protein
VDAQGRGRADGIDPADQWVFDPKTGSYELRLDPTGHTGPGPGQDAPPAALTDPASGTSSFVSPRGPSRTQSGAPSLTPSTGRGKPDAGKSGTRKPGAVGPDARPVPGQRDGGRRGGGKGGGPQAATGRRKAKPG